MTGLVWSFALASVGIFGLWLAGRHNAVGWAVGFGAQLLWVAYATATEQWGFYVSAAGYGWVYARNYLAWRREARAVLQEPGWGQ